MAKTDEVVSAKMIPVVQGIVDWIEAHIFDTLSVSAIAKKSGYSHWYFQRQFAMVTGCTLASYVSRRKMTIATIYLTQTQASIQSISQCLDTRDKPLSAGPFTVTLACRRPAIVVIRRAKRAICNIPCGWGWRSSRRRSAAAAADRDQRMVFGVMTRRAPT